MRINETDQQIVVTDQAFGWAAFLVALGALMIVLGLAGLAARDGVTGPVLKTAAGGLFLVLGLRSMAAWQLILDRDEGTALYREWRLVGVVTRRFALKDIAAMQVVGGKRAVVLIEGPEPAVRIGDCRKRHSAVMALVEERLRGA